MTEPKLYARPDGWHYHVDHNCSMLAGGQFEELGYVGITMEDAKKRKLIPCGCTELTKEGVLEWAERVNKSRNLRLSKERAK